MSEVVCSVSSYRGDDEKPAAVGAYSPGHTPTLAEEISW